jgi:hypothetical protein
VTLLNRWETHNSYCHGRRKTCFLEHGYCDISCRGATQSLIRQADDLLNDIYIVKSNNPGTPLSEMLSKLEPLVERLSREVHLYLWFVGD